MAREPHEFSSRQRVEPMGTSKGAGDVRAGDVELARRCQSGDAGAIEELYSRYAGRLSNLAFRMAGSAHDLDNTAQAESNQTDEVDDTDPVPSGRSTSAKTGESIKSPTAPAATRRWAPGSTGSG